MQLHSAERRVSLSVGELANFRLGPEESGFGATGRWRMALGSAWHESLRAELQQEADTAARQTSLEASDNADATAPAGKSTATGVTEAEVPLTVTLIHGGWRFELSGRIDQVQHSDGRTLIREIKTVSEAPPKDPQELQARYPHYLRQLAIYTYGWQVSRGISPAADSVGSAPAAEAAATEQTVNPQEAKQKRSRTTAARKNATAGDALDQAQHTKAVCGELCFVNIHDGTRHALHLSAAQAQEVAIAALERLLPFLEQRARPRSLLAEASSSPLQAFENYRDGQAETLASLQQGLWSAPATLFEAPTGFGKTGVVLELALEQLRTGTFSRVIYLSGKTTGQHQVMRQLRQMNAQSAWRFFQLRSRREHTQQPLRQRTAKNAQSRLSALTGTEPQWEDFGVHPAQLLDEQRADVDSLRSLAARTGLCPYQLAKACLPYADVWVGDYNYVFSPRHRRVFFEQPGFDPRQTLLIVDEAHNLAARVADNHSLSLSTTEAEAVALDLRLANAPFLLTQAWELWAAFLQGIKPAETLDPQVATEAAAHLRTLCERLQSLDAEPEALQPFTREAIGEVFWQAQCLEQADLPRLCWSPRHGVLSISCLDAAAAVGRTLRRFGAAVLMSATIGPHAIFAESIGLPLADTRVVHGEAPWRDSAYSVAIDTTVDTRLRSRASFYRQTAETIGRFAQGALGPLTVFFPSYQYAEVVLKYLEALHPELIVKVQPRAIDPGGQLTFVEESLLLAHVLFFVLGSSFSESIDHLGGRVDRAMVVGPALPEVNPVQNAKLARAEPLGREEAFARVYQIPALQKINQALGRLVRAPGQSARVLLHDQRFALPSYRRLLAPEYREAEVLSTPRALQQWIDQ